MAFETNQNAVESVVAAGSLVATIRLAYQQLKRMQSLMATYQAATDPVFNAAVNYLYTVPERTEIAAALTDVNTLVTHLETNHKALLGLP